MQKALLVTGLALGLAGVAHAQDKAKAPAPAAADKTKAPAPAAPTPAATDKKAGAAMGAAGQQPPEAPPAPPKPGPETEALKPFSHNMTWTGKSPAGAWGPGSPEMATKGSAKCKWVVNNLWVTCDLEDTMGTGKDAMKWTAHEVYGWNFTAKEYRAYMADSYGTSSEMIGKLDGQKLTWESAKEQMMMGKPTKFRATFDATDPKAIKMVTEHTVAGKWVVDEEATLKPSK